MEGGDEGWCDGEGEWEEDCVREEGRMWCGAWCRVECGFATQDTPPNRSEANSS